MEEVVPAAANGSAIMVVWNDPAKTNSMVALQFSSLRTSEGTSVSIPLAPVNTLAPDYNMKMGLGIGHSTGTETEISSVFINGSLITATAGGADDGNTIKTGPGGAGQLITIGGDNDTPGPNSELYDLAALGAIANGATSIDLTTSSDHLYDYLSIVWI